MKKCNVGIVGCGHLGKLHLKNLIELSKEDNRISIKGCYDKDMNKAKSICQDTGIYCFGSLSEILNSIDAVFIITSTSSHFELAEIFLKNRKHIFIEKPVTNKIEEAYRLKELQGNTIIQVGHIERFNPAILFLDTYNIEPMFIESHRLAQFNPRGTDVSVIQDLMIHDIDIILHLVKSRVKNIQANGVPVLSDNVDIANSRITFENGCVANITASRISLKKMRKMRVFQSKSYISIDFLNNSTEVFRIRDVNNKGKNEVTIPFEFGGNMINIGYEKKDSENNNPMKYEQNLFFECIFEGKKPLVTLEDGINALEVASWINEEIGNKQKNEKNFPR